MRRPPLWEKAAHSTSGAGSDHEVDGDHLGHLDRDGFEGVLCGIESVTRSEQRADGAQLVVGCAVHDGDEEVAGEQGGQLFVGNATVLDALQECRRDEHETRPRLGQPLVDLPHEGLPQDDVPFAEPDRNVLAFKEVIELGRHAPTVVPCVAQEDVADERSLTGTHLDLLAVGRKGLYLLRGVPHGRASR